jgi:hypothetical protein
MHIGTRITFPEEAGRWDVDLLQISVYHGMKDNLTLMEKCVTKCREEGIRYVIHPVLYSIMDKEMFRSLKMMAEWADLALILHDEKTIDWQRITGTHKITFKALLGELQSVTPVSFENATDTKDVVWFWNTYADSITLDIGHVELAGMNSVEFVNSLAGEIIEKIQYVHIHRNNGWRNGLTDHWYLLPGCREVKALEALLRRKQDIGVFLEVNETEKIEESLMILRTLRDEIGISPS